MRILIGMPDPESWGGVQNCEPPFVAALKKLPDVETAEATYVFGDKLTKTGFSRRIRRVLATAAKFRRHLRENDFDLIHLNTSFDEKAVLRDLTAVSLMKNQRTKIFLKMHGSDDRLLKTKSLIKRIWWKNLLAKVDGIGVLSSEERANFVRAGIDEDKIFVVKNAVQLPPQSPRKFDEKQFRMLFVSRFLPTKGLLETIRAAAILRERKIDFVLNCVGDGETRQTAENLTDELNLRQFVTFHGYVAEETVAEFYQTSDLLIFPTFHIEGFPMVIFNAVAHGLPIVTTKIRAAADYLSEPENCLWTNARNAENLADRIVELFENANLRQRMSENNRKLSENFTAEKIAPQYLEIYRRIVRRP